MKITFVKKTKEAEGVYSFYFDTSKNFSFFPGQYIYLSIPDLVDDYRGPTRHFTISSIPQDKNIRITTNIRKKSSYKQSLMNLKINDVLEASGPTGTFILDEKEEGKHILIAGGIGITPFLSFIRYNKTENLNSELHLLYSVKSKNKGAFIDKLKDISDKNDKIKMNLTYTGNAPDNWSGFKGRVDKNMIIEMVNNPKKFTFWLCGPPKMVSSIEKILINMNISTNKIRSEKFTGY